jgi:hypothetical protein
MARQFPVEYKGHEFEFTRRWFLNRNYPTFVQYVLPEWQVKPVTYLELGVFEGMSLAWMLIHVLTHPEARAVGVDPHLITTKLDERDMEAVRLRALHNLEPWIYPVDSVCDLWKCRLIRGNSAEVLRRMCHKGYAGIAKNSVDLCMVDGNHNALAVLDDCRFVYQLLKPGGWMLLDDVVNDQPKKDHVEEGLRMFLTEQPMQMMFKHRYMECYRK